MAKSCHNNVDGRTVRKQVHHVESRMEYYWELRSKNAQNIKAVMCPLYFYESFCYWFQGLTGSLPFLLVNLIIAQCIYS